MKHYKFYELFNEIFLDWFDNCDYDTQKEMLEEMTEFKVEELEGYEDDCDLIDIAKEYWGDSWYNYAKENHKLLKDFDFEETIKDVLTKGAGNIATDYDFADDFLDSYTSNIVDYDDPEGFFMDLQNGGCQSGMIGGLIYYDDIKKLYVDNIDSFDDYYEELEGNIGCPIERQKGLPRYNQVVWTCYEEMAYNIHSYLFEEQ